MPLAVAVAVGAVLSLLGVVLLLPLPEAGLPLLLGGLRLLGRRYEWARSLNRRVDRVAEAVMATYRRQPTPVRLVAMVGVIALAALAAYFVSRHLLM